MGVSFNGGPQSPPQKLIISSRKTHGCWVLTIFGNPQVVFLGKGLQQNMVSIQRNLKQDLPRPKTNIGFGN